MNQEQQEVMLMVGCSTESGKMHDRARIVAACWFFMIWMLALAHGHGAPLWIFRAEYVGGTEQFRNGANVTLDLKSPDVAVVSSDKGPTIGLRYASLTSVEYGEHVGRRNLLAITADDRKRAHFVTICFTAEDDKLRGIVLRVKQADVHVMLNLLERRSGKLVEFESKEAERSFRGADFRRALEHGSKGGGAK